MVQTNILKLNAASNKPAARQGRQAATRKAAATIAGQFRRQHIAAGAVALLAGSLTFLSVHHLATGYQAVTHCADWEAIISACGIDLGFLLLEITQLVTVRDATLKVVARQRSTQLIRLHAGRRRLAAGDRRSDHDGLLPPRVHLRPHPGERAPRPSLSPASAIDDEIQERLMLDYKQFARNI
jgi:hypothetical protein